MTARSISFLKSYSILESWFKKSGVRNVAICHTLLPGRVAGVLRGF